MVGAMTHVSVARRKSRKRFAWLLQWGATERKTGYLCTLVLVACGLFLAAFLFATWSDFRTEAANGRLPFWDFFALWSYGKIAINHPVIELYDPAILHARALDLGMDPSRRIWFPYPPVAIFVFWPLGLMPFGAAYLVWVVATLGAFLCVLVATCSRAPVCIIGAVVAPVTTATICYGQSGFLAAALIIAGIRLAPCRPVCAGILLGLLSFKPQLGLLVPIALISAGYWRALWVSCATVAGLIVLSVVAFGWSVWLAWIAVLLPYQAAFDIRIVHQLYLMPTVVSNLKLMGLPSSVANYAQLASAVAVVVIVGRCFYLNAGGLAVGALLVGTFLATPHAFIYDAPMILGAMALLIEEERLRSGTFSLATILVLLLAMLFPAMMLINYPDVPVSCLSLFLLFWIILRQGRLLAPGGLEATAAVELRRS